MRLINQWLVIAGFGLLAVSPASAATIISTFNVDDEEWEASGAEVSHSKKGGFSGGQLHFEDNQDDTFSVFAPPEFLGNLSKFNGGRIAYDVRVPNITPSSLIGSGFGRIELTGGGSNATFDWAGNPPVPSSKYWTTYQIPLTAKAWNTTPENWAQVLSNVTSWDIILEPSVGPDEVDFDNFRVDDRRARFLNRSHLPGLAPTKIASAYTYTPEPSSIFLLGSGLLGLAGVGVRRRRRS